MSDKLTFDPSLSFEEMVAFVAQGKGIDLAAFNTSPKGLRDLYKEVTRREILLVRDTDGLIKRIVKNVKIVIVDPARSRTWIEVARSYPNGTIVTKEQEYAIRETCKYQEEPFNAAVRGLAKELGYHFGVSEPSAALVLLPIGRKNPDYPSSVYPGIITSATSYWYVLTITEFMAEDMYKVRKDDEDNDGDPNAWVEIHIVAIDHT